MKELLWQSAVQSGTFSRCSIQGVKETKGNTYNNELELLWFHLVFRCPYSNMVKEYTSVKTITTTSTTILVIFSGKHAEFLTTTNLGHISRTACPCRRRKHKRRWLLHTRSCLSLSWPRRCTREPTICHARPKECTWSAKYLLDSCSSKSRTFR